MPMAQEASVLLRPPAVDLLYDVDGGFQGCTGAFPPPRALRFACPDLIEGGRVVRWIILELIVMPPDGQSPLP
jgi:hypothetical protein